MRNKSGFTLLELMITIAIIAILSVALVPNLIAWRNNAQLSRGARQIYSDLQEARKTAINRGFLVTVDFDSDTTYKIYRNGALAVSRDLPPGVVIDNVEFIADGGTAIASFNSWGFGRTFTNLDNSGTVTVNRDGGGRSVTIEVNSAGSIRIL